MTTQKRLEHKALGLCIECNEKAETGRCRCKKCLDKQNKYNAIRRKNNIKAGKCKCGREKSPDKYRCNTCNESNNTYAKRKRLLWKESGMCIRCGKPLLERTDVSKCINCMEGSLNFKWN